MGSCEKSARGGARASFGRPRGRIPFRPWLATDMLVRRPNASPREARMGKLLVLMVTAFVDMVGFAMVLPLVPFYASSMGATGFIVGLLISSFSVAQLVSAPTWGRVSDLFGRRPAVITGLLISAVAYVVFGLAGTLWILLLSRVVQGVGGGTVGRASCRERGEVCGAVGE